MPSFDIVPAKSEHMNAFVEALRRRLEGDVWADAMTRGLYATDASVYEMMPVAVATPKHEADVVAALELARAYGVPVLARGAATSLAGQTVARGLVLDFTRYMNRTLALDPQARTARVQPGVVRDQLNLEAAPYRLHFAPDPATTSRCTFGGMIANNSSGTRSIRYGRTSEHLVALRVALADGTIHEFHALSPEAWRQKELQGDREATLYAGFRQIVEPLQEEIRRRYPKTLRRVGGYALDAFPAGADWNLSHLICGSEGTLGIILEATVRLEPVPRHSLLVVVHFDDLREALAAVQHMDDFGPSAIELLDRTVLHTARNNRITAAQCHFVQGDPAAVQVVEFQSDEPAEAENRARAMIGHLRKLGLGNAFPVLTDPRHIADVWSVRKNGLGLIMNRPGDRRPLAFIEDAAVPVEVLPDYISDVLAICAKHGVEATAYAHASVGVIHVRPWLDLRKRDDIERFRRISEEVFERVVHYGGSWSSEHGDGLVRSPHLPRFYGPKIYDAFRQIKHLFDPDHLLNPGKIVDAPPMTENLRYGPDWREQPPPQSWYRYREGNFAAAVHMCTGVGACRQMRGGTMCPSFRATRDEAHSTRGRANALRLAMGGRLPEDLAGEGVAEVLDLCLSCKACKTECPSNVDMARLKSEVMQLRFDRKGMPLGERFIDMSAAVARRLAGPLAPFVNVVQRSAPFRYALERLAGFDRRRVLPPYTSKPFRSMTAPDRAPSGKKVVLFADTWTQCHDSHLGRAAARVLQKLGYEVEVVARGCCQRPRISHGHLRKAVAAGQRTVEHLRPWLEKGVPVLVLEPSCASAFTDDLADLLPDVALAQKLKQGVHFLDAWLAEQLRRGEVAPRWKEGRHAGRMLVHGHCHQKALWSTADTVALLQALPGAEVEEIPSGCCGMAGSFGYEKGHYELSLKIAEEVLLPAIRKEPEATVVAPGFSCRHQIADFAGRQALHWVELWAQWLA